MEEAWGGRKEAVREGREVARRNKREKPLKERSGLRAEDWGKVKRKAEMAWGMCQCPPQTTPHPRAAGLWLLPMTSVSRTRISPSPSTQLYN